MIALLLACGPKPAPAPVAVELDRSRMPDALAPRSFTLPALQHGELDNGIEVLLAEDHELPLVRVRLALDVGSANDPAELTRLASVTVDMMNEGAGELDVTALEQERRRLGMGLSRSAGGDSTSISSTHLSRNLEPGLDLMATVVREPTFPDELWEVEKKSRLQAWERALTKPGDLASRVHGALLFGDAYHGRLSQAEHYEAMDTAAMADWHAQHVHAGNATFLVAGDVTLDELVPLLNARFGDWSADGADPEPAPTQQQPEATTIYLVDLPGSAQSVIRGARFVPARGADDFDALQVGNLIFGGQFTSRLNMNLREDKGWTYGARSGMSYAHDMSRWAFSSSVKSEVTADALAETLRELSAVADEKPFTAEELAYQQSSATLGYPRRFEKASYLLDRTWDERLYGLAEDWTETFPERVGGVTLEAAQAAFVEHVVSQPLAILVVGDAASIREPLEALGHPVVLLDRDARPLEN